MSLLSSMPFPIQFFLAFLVVLGLIAGDRMGGEAVRRRPVGSAAARGRQPRLGVVDHANVDSRRRLLIIRRDNVEHLVMVGGPTDVVVETNIVRGAVGHARRRDRHARRPAPTHCRAPSRCRTARSNGSWPLQPEPAAGSVAACRAQRAGGAVFVAVAVAARSTGARQTATHSAHFTTNSPAVQCAAAKPPADEPAAVFRPNRACRARSLPSPNPERPSIKASRKWRIGSKRLCASRPPSRRRTRCAADRDAASATPVNHTRRDSAPPAPSRRHASAERRQDALRQP